MTNLEKAARAWGTGLPDWVRVLAEECDLSNQSEVSRKIGYSGTAINQILYKKYAGNLERIQTAIEGRLMGKTLVCPVLGEVSKDICLEKQKQPFAATNAQRVRLYKVCPACPQNRMKR